MLGHRLRCWPNIRPVLVYSVVTPGLDTLSETKIITKFFRVVPQFTLVNYSSKFNVSNTDILVILIDVDAIYFLKRKVQDPYDPPPLWTWH